MATDEDVRLKTGTKCYILMESEDHIITRSQDHIEKLLRLVIQLQLK